MKLPPRQRRKYERPPKQTERIVPERYVVRAPALRVRSQLCVARRSWTERTALEPSPTAAATRFIEPWRTSPAANTPGTEVSNGSGAGRARGQRPAAAGGR